MMVLRLPNTKKDSDSEDDYDDEAVDQDNDRISQMREKNRIAEADEEEEEDYETMMEENRKLREHLRQLKESKGETIKPVVKETKVKQRVPSPDSSDIEVNDKFG